VAGAVGALLGAAAVGITAWMSSEEEKERKGNQQNRLEQENKQLKNALRREMETRGAASSSSSSSSSAGPAVAAGVRTVPSPVAGRHSGGGGKVPESVPEERLCCICQEKEIAVAFIPCGHAKCCADCSTEVRDCPVCRASIQRRQRIYL